MTRSDVSWTLTALAEDYPAWWVDMLGEHSHVGGIETTRWLLERAAIGAGARMLDAGAFVGAAARLAAIETGCRAVAIDVVADFLAAGRSLQGGDLPAWVVAANQRLPFASGTFDTVWCLDAPVMPREFTRVAAAGATLCLCCEAPTDGRGGLEAFLDEWAALGWRLKAHRAASLDALQTWRGVETALVRRRPLREQRYGRRGYLAQLDAIAERVRRYERGEEGHGLFVFQRP